MTTEQREELLLIMMNWRDKYRRYTRRDVAEAFHHCADDLDAFLKREEHGPSITPYQEPTS